MIVRPTEYFLRKCSFITTRNTVIRLIGVLASHRFKGPHAKPRSQLKRTVLFQHHENTSITSKGGNGNAASAVTVLPKPQR